MWWKAETVKVRRLGRVCDTMWRVKTKVSCLVGLDGVIPKLFIQHSAQTFYVLPVGFIGKGRWEA